MKKSTLYNLIKYTDQYKETGDEVNYVITTGPAVKKTKIVYLLFECSNGNTDWKNNLNFFPKYYKKPETMYSNSNMTCHRGFAGAYISAKDVIMEELFEFMKEHLDYILVIAGWSLGGAMALLAAEDYNYRTRTDKANPETGKKAILITYGAPKVAANERTATYLASCIDKRSQQFAHTQDIVTHVPPFKRYYHPIPQTWVGPKINPITVFGLFNGKKYHTRYDEWIKKYNVDEDIDVILNVA